jgi:hypothetical protein
MHTALWKLYRLRIYGSIRATARKVKSPRGAALALFTLVVLGLMLGPNLFMAFKSGPGGMRGLQADSFREFFPVAMFLYVMLNIVTSIGERALYFSPSDIDFLFPAPFSRRQVLLFKILGNVTGAVFVAMILPVSLIAFIRSFPLAMVGCFLAWHMVSSLTMCAQLVAQTVGEQSFTRARKLLLGAVIVVIAVALGQAARQGVDGPLTETLLRARHSLLVEVVLAPFAIFARIITAEQLLPETLGWMALGALLVVAIYALVVRLDANYLETAVRVSRKMQERKLRAMSGGAFAPRSGKLRSSRMPHLPWWGGTGPLIWRQVVQAFRVSRSAILLMVIAMAAMAGPMAFGARHSDALPRMIIGLSFYVTFLYSAQAPLGFRGDFDRMDLLKSLPIRPLAMACGQTLVITLMLTFMQWIVFAATALFFPATAVELLAVALFVLPTNWILSGTENLFFLLYPSPLVVGSEGFLRMGRVMLVMLAKFLVLTACGALAALPAAGVYFLTQSVAAACIVAWLMLLLPVVCILLLIAWAFQRYDVTTATGD